MSSNSNKHLTLDERKIIEAGITNGASKTSIADNIGKDPSTVAKEIKLHRKLKERASFYGNNCIHLKKECYRCTQRCERYVPVPCKRKDRSPGACNGCDKISRCFLDRYFYKADIAHNEYLESLVDSRMGVDLTYNQVKDMAAIIKPLIDQGQSPYEIILNHKELNICEKTLYNYISIGIFRKFGILNINLKKKVSRKLSKEYPCKPRNKQPQFLDGRRYSDYLLYIENHPDIPVVEMDTVYNEDKKHYIQTFMFTKIGFMFGIIHKEKTKESMFAGINYLYQLLGHEQFTTLFPIILTDRGAEFYACEDMEIDPETKMVRTHIFYCDPMQSSQKPHVERNHNFIRDILPNGASTEELTQEKLDLMFSHINSVPRESLNGKTPYELFEFLYGQKILDLLNIKKIDKDQVTLKPYLIK